MLWWTWLGVGRASGSWATHVTLTVAFYFSHTHWHDMDLISTAALSKERFCFQINPSLKLWFIVQENYRICLWCYQPSMAALQELERLLKHYSTFPINFTKVMFEELSASVLFSSGSFKWFSNNSIELLVQLLSCLRYYTSWCIS